MQRPVDGTDPECKATQLCSPSGLSGSGGSATAEDKLVQGQLEKFQQEVATLQVGSYQCCRYYLRRIFRLVITGNIRDITRYNMVLTGPQLRWR